AALAGSIAAALAAMVANLTIAKPGFSARYAELDALAVSAQSLKDRLMMAVDEDTQAFNGVIEAMRLPQDTPQQQAARHEAMQAGYRHATEVPMGVARLCREVLDLALAAARCGNDAMITDAGVAGLMALAGLKGALYNARINLKSIKDAAYASGLKAE